jgi:hypothetical protein
MTYGIYNTLMNIVGIACIAILVAFVFVRLIAILLAFTTNTECTGDCDQGRHCACEEKKNG